MTYLLDTNVCICYLNGRSESVKERFEALHPADIFLCSVVKSELLAGAYKSNNRQRTLEKLRLFFAPLQSLPFDDEAAVVYGQIRSNLERRGTPIGPYDLQIASIAIAKGLVLVTHNLREFGRVRGLILEDWE